MQVVTMLCLAYFTTVHGEDREPSSGKHVSKSSAMAFIGVRRKCANRFVMNVESLIVLSDAGASINVVNKCSYSVTAFARGLNYPQRTIGALSTGQSQVLDVGASFISGLIWGSPHGDTDPSHATQLEFNIGSAGQPPRDYYDISLVVSTAKTRCGCVFPWQSMLHKLCHPTRYHVLGFMSMFFAELTPQTGISMQF